MVRRVCPIVLVVALAVACRSGSGARYLVTQRPIDVGLGIALCIALDQRDARGIWWWGAGSTGCDSRSTGPDVIRGEAANVSQRERGGATQAGFTVGTHSATRPYIDVRLVVEDGTMRVVETGALVPVVHRSDLDIPSRVGR